MFPTSVRVAARSGSRVEGRQECRFGHGTGRWSFSGVVLAGRATYVTDRLSGSVTFPGLYEGEVSDAQVVGRWRVPSCYQEGEFAFTRERVLKDVVGFRPEAGSFILTMSPGYERAFGR